MATPRCDHSAPKYFDAVAVNNGDTITGGVLQLNGCLALNFQLITTNGCAGTFYLDGTNQDAGTLSYVTPTTQTINANQQLVLSYSLEDNITSMHKFRCRFVASAPGNFTVALNMRHTTR